MPRSKITSEGQIELPKVIRLKLKLDPGDHVDFVIQPNGDVLLKPANFDIRKLEGILKSRKERSVTMVEMKTAVRPKPRNNDRS